MSACFQCSQEYEIDKTLGIKGPEDVAKMGIKEYNNQCRGIVMRYSKEWEVSKGTACILLCISNCVCAEVFNWCELHPSGCLIVCINLVSSAAVFLTGHPERGTKNHHNGSEQGTAVMSGESYFKVTWSSECLTSYMEHLIDILNRYISSCLLYRKWKVRPDLGFQTELVKEMLINLPAFLPCRFSVLSLPECIAYRHWCCLYFCTSRNSSI